MNKKEPSIVWHENGLIKILPINSETIYFTDYSDELYRQVSGIRWRVTWGYLRGYVNGQNTQLHHLILSKEEGKVCDHINRKRNDNRSCNLRNITRSENKVNAGLTKSNTSGYLGVSWNKREKKWRSAIKVNKITKTLGYFDDPKEAHLTYLEAVEWYHPGILYPEQLCIH